MHIKCRDFLAVSSSSAPWSLRNWRPRACGACACGAGACMHASLCLATTYRIISLAACAEHKYYICFKKQPYQKILWFSRIVTHLVHGYAKLWQGSPQVTLGVVRVVTPVHLLHPIKGRFYASVSVLYLTGRFYAKNFGTHSLVNNKGKCTLKGKILILRPY